MDAATLAGFEAVELVEEEGWFKSVGLANYAPHRPGLLDFLQQVLFAYTEAI